MNAKEKAAQEKLKQMGKTNKTPFVVDQTGVRHTPDEGTIKDGLLRRMAKLPPKRVK